MPLHLKTRVRWSKNRGPLHWNEAKDVVEKLKSTWTKLKKKHFTEFAARKDEILKWLDDLETLPFDTNILLATKKRMIAGNFTKRPSDSPHSSENDCYIIETLIHFFEGQLKGKELLLCTENIDDFGVKGALHKWFQDGLPTTRIVRDLESLVAFIKAAKPIELPSPEEMERAEKERAERIAREEQATQAWSAAVPTISVGQSTVAFHPASTTYYYPVSGSPYFYPNYGGFLMAPGDDEHKRLKEEENRRLIQARLDQQRLRDQIGS